jgi:gamma-glutamyltranspeptidase/glutathione hydrolase
MAGMVVAPEPIAAEEGVKILMAGGNAVDAAVVTALVQSVAEPQMCGIGGYTTMILHKAVQPGMVEPNPVILDGPALAGSRCTPSMWEDIFLGSGHMGWGYVLQGEVNTIGYSSICTPGTVLALSTMLNRWGTMSWGDVIEPAARITDEGFIVSNDLANDWRIKFLDRFTLADVLRSNAEASRIFLHEDGLPYDVGQVLRNPDYARSLRWLAAEGPQDFYEGRMAKIISDDFAANGAFVTADDLAGYKVRDELPTTTTYRGYRIASSPPPHGGPTLLEILNILEGYNLAALGHNSAEYICLVSMAMKAAFADRNQYIGDPAFVDVPLDWLVSKERAAEWRLKIDSGTPIEAPRLPEAGHGTTYLGVVDGQGNVVGLTHSLGTSSGVITPGLGFIHNNSMTNAHPLPGHPNSIAPGKGRATGMAPTIVYKGQTPIMLVGAPGGNKIINSVLQVILNMLDFGMGTVEAVSEPRFDCQGPTIFCEGRIPGYVCDEVRKRHPIERLPFNRGGLALVHAITIDQSTGILRGGADTGYGGVALLAS